MSVLTLVLSVLMPISVLATKELVHENGSDEKIIVKENALIDSIVNGKSVMSIDLSNRFLSAMDFGAVGDGETDDTDALEVLFELAFLLKKAVYFEPGTYIICRSLLLRSGMEIYGKDATIKKKEAMVATLAESTERGQDYIVLSDVGGLKIGDQFVIADRGGANKSTYGIVTDIKGNRVAFTNILNDHQNNLQGCIKAYDVGTRVSNSFALLRSWSSIYECDGVLIHDITLDGCRRIGEPMVWANSCIHLDSYYPRRINSQGNSLITGVLSFFGFFDQITLKLLFMSELTKKLSIVSDAIYRLFRLFNIDIVFNKGNLGSEYRNIQRGLIVKNVIIRNSPCDGISDQGEGGLVVRDCIIENPACHGVHMGTKFSSAIIDNNTLTGNGSCGAGVFFCQDVKDVLVVNNSISYFYHGCSDEEYGTAARNVTIKNNEFNHINDYVFDFMGPTKYFHGSGLHISDNKVFNLNSLLFSGVYLDNVVISDNIVKSVVTQTSNLIRVTKSQDVVITGNTVPKAATWDKTVNATKTDNLNMEQNSWNK